MRKCSVDFSTAFSYENAVLDLSAFLSDNAILDEGEECCVESIIKGFRQENTCIINWWVKNSLSIPI